VRVLPVDVDDARRAIEVARLEVPAEGEETFTCGSPLRHTRRRELPAMVLDGSHLEVAAASVPAAALPLPWGDVLVRLGVDLLAIAVLAYGIYFRRHGRRDLVVIYAMFNVGLFLALVVMTAGSVSVGVGFGLFAVLSIVRLRSEPFSNVELAYFFVALVLALLCGLDLGGPLAAAGLATLAVAAAAVIDHPRLLPATRRTELVLELVFADDDALRRHVEERLDAEVSELSVVEIDYVREITHVAVRFVPRPRAAPREPEALGDRPVAVVAR
jgi:hypothetical protein